MQKLLLLRFKVVRLNEHMLADEVCNKLLFYNGTQNNILLFLGLVARQPEDDGQQS
jgi:hypothetical protein